MNILKTVFVMLGLFVPAYSLTVDFAPIQVGNVWVYEESYKNDPWSPEYNITKTIQITKTESRNDTTYFSAFVRDSGIVDTSYNGFKWIDAQYNVQGFKTKDTVKTSKANDSIVVSENGIENFNIGGFFPFPVRDTFSTPDERFYVWENLIIDRYDVNRAGGALTNIDSFILLQNVGLLERSHTVIWWSGGTPEPGGGTTTITLISFNGKPAPNINLTSVNHFLQNKRKNSNQIAFRQLRWINQGNHIGPKNVRAVFDVRGRAVSASGLTNRHLNNGIYLYSD